jgi:pyruvate dehydrogenase E2 component (dihydrolipoamide acetyltransferase)
MQMRLPRLGEGADSGTVVNVLVREGDRINKDQTVIELENDKAVAPIPATEAGVVAKVLVKVGDNVSVGQPILELAGGAAAAPQAPAAVAPSPAPAAQPQAVAVAQPMPLPAAQPAAFAASAAAGGYQHPSPTGAPPPAAPSLRKMALQLGLDLSRVPGSGHGGRITLEDVRRYLAQLQQWVAQPPSPAPGMPAAAQPSAPPRPVPKLVDFERFGTTKRQPLTSLRKKIAEQMVTSATIIPHVTQFDDADVTGLMGLRNVHKAAYEKAGGSLTLTVFVLKALVDTLKKHPVFNASIDEARGEVVYKAYYHIGIAVDTENGLIVPVIRDVDKKSLLQLSVELASIAQKTRERKVSADELQGGSFTISNQGSIGGGYFTPIINHPEVAILGLGRGSVRPIFSGKKLEPRSILPVSLSYDHRLIDGGSAARFTTEFVQALEHFDEAVVKLPAAPRSTGTKAIVSAKAKTAKKASTRKGK